MSVSLSLFKVTSDFLCLSFEERVLSLCEDTTESFGSRAKVIERLCLIPEFFHDIREDEKSVERCDELRNKDFSSTFSEPSIWTHLNYQYRHHQQQGTVLRYLAQGDPVTCISANRAYPEDFWPIIQLLANDDPIFLVFDPMRSRLIYPEEFEYSCEDWMQKNYEEDMWSFSY